MKRLVFDLAPQASQKNTWPKKHNGIPLDIVTVKGRARSSWARLPVMLSWPNGFSEAWGTKAKQPHLFRKRLFLGLGTPGLQTNTRPKHHSGPCTPIPYGEIERTQGLTPTPGETPVVLCTPPRAQLDPACLVEFANASRLIFAVVPLIATGARSLGFYGAQTPCPIAGRPATLAI